MPLFDFLLRKAAPPAPPKLSVRGSATLGGGIRSRKLVNDALWQCYRNNPWAYRAVRSIAGAISKGYELIAVDQQEEVEDLPELEAFLNHPNETDSFEELVGNIATSMLVFGACYLEVQRQGLDADQARVLVQKAWTLTGNADIVPEGFLDQNDVVNAAVINGIPIGMQVLPAQQIEVLVDKTGVITGYKQQTDDGRTIKFAPHEIVLMTYPGSMDKHYGDSPIEPISNTITNDTLIRRRQQAKLMNLLGVSHLISLPENTSDDDVSRYHETLMTQYRGSSADGSFIVTNLPIKVEHMDTTAEGDYLKLRECHKEEISLTLGIPLAVLGNTEGSALTGSGGSQTYRAFIENTCRPLARHIQADLNRQIVEPFLQLTESVNVMLRLVLEDTTDNQAQEDLYNTAVENGTLTVNEVRAKRGMLPIAGGDEAYINAKGVQVVSQLGQLPVVAAPPLEQTDPPAADDTPPKTVKKTRVRRAA